MMIENLTTWLDKHEVEIERLGIDRVAEACYTATYKRDLEEYIAEQYDYVKEQLKPECLVTEDAVRKQLRQQFDHDRTADDYMPLWAWAWHFPTSHSDSELNGFDVPGVVFFHLDITTYVSLRTVGMDMTPSLKTAYLLYSDLNLSTEYVRNEILQEPGYFSYVVGRSSFQKVCTAVGLTPERIAHAEQEVKHRLEAFNQSLNDLSALRKAGKITQDEASLLGLLTYLKYDAT